MDSWLPEPPKEQVVEKRLIYPRTWVDYLKFKFKRWLEPDWVMEIHREKVGEK